MSFRLNLISLLRSFSSFLILILSFYGCSVHVDSYRKMKLSVEIKNVEIWVDLMPGNQHYFYVIADGYITNNGNFTVKDLKIEKASIYQDAKPIINFNPLAKWTDSSSSEINFTDTLKSLIEKKKAKFSFKNRLNYIPQNILNQNDPINILLHFSSDTSSFYYWIKEIKIEKVY